MSRVLLPLLLYSLLSVECSSLHYHSSLTDLSPIDFGLLNANSGIERYQILYETHKEAIARGKRVSYRGIDSIDLEIPANAKSIPLSSNNDFSGVCFNVLNNQKDIYLFSIVQSPHPITISKKDIDRGSFMNYSAISKGRILLVIYDDNLWVNNREGYSYGHTRKDVLLVKNGHAVNKTIMPYDNSDSSPRCEFFNASSFCFSNVSFSRMEGCAHKTFLLSIRGFDDVHINNINVHTPKNNMTSDAVMRINDCTNVSIDNVTIDGTYSRKDYSGYAFSLNNIWSLSVNNLQAQANWSVFGTNNMSSIHISNSRTNNFDIHCYGRDIEFNNVQFVGRFVQLASVYGDVVFRNCSFSDARVITNGMSYNAYVEYNLLLDNCTFNASKDKSIILDCGRLDNRVNARSELKKRSLPNITINNLTINVLEDIGGVSLLFFRTEEEFSRTIDGFSFLRINGVRFNYPPSISLPTNFYISNTPITISRQPTIDLNDVDVIGSTTRIRTNRGKVITNVRYKTSPIRFQTRTVNASAIE